MREHAQSSVIGFVLVFGIIISLLVILQTTAVPVWNQGIEVSHNEAVQDEMESVRESAFRTSTTGTGTSQSISLGTRYPVRPFLFNPPDPTGRIETADPGQLRITNATVPGETGDYWNGSTRSFTNRALVYEPDYNEYRNAPTTVLENMVLYNRFDGAILPKTETQLVSGQRITLITLDGSLSRGGTASQNLEIRPLSAPQQVTTVQSDRPITITTPTRLPQQEWEELLADERTETGGHIREISVTPGDPGQLRLTLEADQSYDLRMAKLGVSSEADDPGPHYITTDSPRELRLREGDSERIVFEVRDRYNNPISGVKVNITSDTAGLTSVQPVTDNGGRAVFRYDAAGTGTKTIQAAFDGGTGRRQANVTVETAPAPSGGEQALSLEWTDPASGSEQTIDAADGPVDLTAAISPGLEDIDVQYRLSDDAVGSLSASDGTTDNAGQSTVRFTPTSDGTTEVYAIGAGDVDVFTLTVTNASGIGTPTATGPTTAFNDENGNGVYDEGERTYTDVGNFDDETVDLVIERDVQRNGGIDILANTVTVRSGVTIDSPQNDLSIEATGGTLDLSGATLRAGKTTQERDIELEAENGDIDVRETTLQANGKIVATPADDGVLFVTNSANSNGGGTTIEDRDGASATLSLEAGSVDGTPEKGNVEDNT